MKPVTLKEFESEFSKIDSKIKDVKNQLNIVASFNDLYNNIIPGEIIIVSARPSIGKTSFIFNLMMHQVSSKGEKILLLSCKNKPEANLIKIRDLFNKKTFLDSNDDILMNPKLITNTNKAIDFISYSIKTHNVRTVYIDDIHGLSWIHDFYIECDDLEGMDYKSQPISTKESDLLYNYLKYISYKLNITIVISEIISRESEFRGGNSIRPQIKDIILEKLELIADKILLLYRPEYYGFIEDENGNSTKNILEVFVAKNKNGISGYVVNLNMENGLIS